MRRLTPVRHGQGRFVDGSPFQAAAGSTRNLTAEAGDALEAAGFQRLGGARGHRYFQNPGLTCPYRQPNPIPYSAPLSQCSGPGTVRQAPCAAMS